MTEKNEYTIDTSDFIKEISDISTDDLGFLISFLKEEKIDYHEEKILISTNLKDFSFYIIYIIQKYMEYKGKIK